MFSKFNKHIDTIFLDPHAKNFDTQEHVNVILSPSLYWVKKVSLPVKYLRDVKSLLPSLFEEILPEGVYSYSAYKKGDVFFIFAYEDKLILDTLSSKGISPTQVHHVYFAQSELLDTDGTVKINDTQSMYLKEELLLVVPSSWIQESSELDISKIILSKNYITLKQFGHIVNDKAIYTIATIFILLISIVAVEYFITEYKVSKTAELKDELFQKYGLKSTMMQNRSILKEYKDIHSVQSKFREYTSYILLLKLQNKEKLTLLSLKGNSLIAEFSEVGKGSAANIEKIFKTENMKYKSSFKETTWHVEIKL